MSWNCKTKLLPFLLGAFADLASLPLIAANAQSPTAAYTVTLHCGRPIPLNTAAIPAIYSWALRLVSSSQGNSGAPDWAFPMWEVNQEYRDALSGDYLRVDFASLATIKTMGGVVHASAIVKGLDPLGPDWRSKYPDNFDDSLFTIDENGTVVGHALYSGLDVFALARAIKKGVSSTDASTRAEELFLEDSQLPPFIRDFLRKNDLQN
jgi:hypothetical protein